MTTKSYTFLVLLCSGFFCAGQSATADYQHARILVAPDPQTETVRGEVSYRFSHPGAGDSLYLDAHDMEFSRVELDGTQAGYKAGSGKLRIAGPSEAGMHELRIHYQARPSQALYFIGWRDSLPGNEQIWTQGQGKDNSHWVPVVDRMGEKVVFDVSVLFETGYQVISNGRLKGTSPEGAKTRWDFVMEKPMSSYLLAFAIGKFDAEVWETSSGLRLEGYYPVGEDEKARWTYRFTPEIFEFLEREIGVPYPWGDYKQVPVRDFLYAGMENTAATFFWDHYLVDSLAYNDENYINVNAHELAHQWFGNLVTETDASQHWLHEGFATFYAYLAETRLFGPERIYWKLYDTARLLGELDASGKGESLLDPGAGSLTFYEKGAWALYMLREEVGEKAFRNGVRGFLRQHAYASATVEDFLKAVEKASGGSLDAFRQQWLEGTAFPLQAAMSFLGRKSESVDGYLNLLERAAGESPPGESEVAEAWNRYGSPEYRAHLLRSFRASLSPAFLESVCGEGSLPVQKAFLETAEAMEGWMVPMVEQWLDAPSYDLREAALFRLWVANPEKRKQYLEQTSQNGSLSQLRLQQLWWLLAVFTEGFGGVEAKQQYLESLRNTTSPAYSWEIRENALAMLSEAGALGRENIRDLMQATEHHTWQFRKFARRLLETLLEEFPEPALMKELARGFPKDHYRYLHEKIESL